MKSGKLTAILITIIIMLLVFIGGTFALMYTGVVTFNKVGEVKPEENKVEQKEEVKEESKEEIKDEDKKVIVGKSWVFDAKLKENKTINDKVGTYVDNSDRCYKVPYLNINSADARKINNEIEKIYTDSYNKFGGRTEDDVLTSTSIDYCHRDYISYDWYINENVVSIVLDFTKFYAYIGEPGQGGLGGGTLTKYVYNINIATLKEATLEEMAKICGFNSAQEVENKVKAWDENVREDKERSFTYEGISNKYYIGENKKLNFLFKWSAAGSGENARVVEPNKDIEKY